MPISGFNAVQINSCQNSALNTIVPQAPAFYKIKGLGIVPQMQIELYIREKRNIQVLGHDDTSRLIGSGPIRPLVRPSKG